MRLLSSLLLIAALTCCDDGLTTDDVRAVVQEEIQREEPRSEESSDDSDAGETVADTPVDVPGAVPDPEPAFAPEAGTIYILAADDSIYLSEQPTADMWDDRVRAYNLSVETYNRRQTKPGPYPYRVAVGARPE